jgi:enediyne biosynthesis protein E4
MLKLNSFIYTIIALSLISCDSKDYILEKVSPLESGVDFINEINDTERINILDYLYYYNGAGVASGDFNNDGLMDLFFVSNQEENKLYFNQGNFKFIDVSKKSGINKISSWNSGVTLVDINSDGWIDIYISSVVGINGFTGHNELWINQGNGQFIEKSKEYGLDLKLYGVITSFFDYDKDGDLDAYIVNHGIHPENNVEKSKLNNNTALLPSNDRLLRNDNGFFYDVTKLAGLVTGNIGYGLAISVTDFNQDGWDDIYISNDFYENDYYYINQKNGTFIESLGSNFLNTSQFSMGSDIGDLNYDGFPELITLDMLPEDEKILKRSFDDNNIQSLRRRRLLGYTDQFPKNHLHVNYNGESFRDVANYAGIESTDWSWSALFSDLDNDGVLDLHVTNGILRRPNDGDFLKYISSDKIKNTIENTRILDSKAIELMPMGLVGDKFYKGNKNVKYEDYGEKWVDEILPSSSSGVVHVDLDNDGDLDIVVNSINENSIIYKNKSQERFNKNFLKIRLKGPEKNKFGIGTKLYAYSDDTLYYRQLHLTRGIYSSQPPEFHIGLGSKRLDSLYLIWPDGQKQNYSVNLNQVNHLEYSSNKLNERIYFELIEKNSKKINIIDLKHKIESTTYPEFDRERLLPIGITETLPVIAIEDINSDGINDFYIGGSKGQSGSIWISKNNGWNKITTESFKNDRIYEDSDAIFTDINGDDQIDLFVASGGGEFKEGSINLQDRIYINKGSNEFVRDHRFSNNNSRNSSQVVGADFNNDGHTDFFVGSRSVPGNYTTPANSTVYINYKGNITDEIQIKFKESLGKVTGVAVYDFDNDGYKDIIATLEWDTIRFLKNKAGKEFIDVTKSYTEPKAGLWQSILSLDYDGDGDQDFLVGNVGTNSRFIGSIDNPIQMYIGDFNNDMVNDPIVTIYKNNNYYPLESFDNLKSQLTNISKHYSTYNSFAGENITSIINKLGVEIYNIYRAEELRSGILINNNNRFTYKPLNEAFQLGPGRVIRALENKNGFLFGGIKNDLPSIQGSWNSQPFTISKFETAKQIINPKYFNTNSNIVPVIDTKDSLVLISASIGSTLKLITLKIDEN